KPAPGDGYAERAQVFNKLVETAQKIDTQRRDDALMADQTIGAHLTSKVDWQNDSTLFSQLRQRYAQSQQVASDYGTAYTPTTKQDAAELSAIVEQLPPKAVLDKLAIMR